MRICCYALMMVLAGVIVFAGVLLAHGHVAPSGLFNRPSSILIDDKTFTKDSFSAVSSLLAARRPSTVEGFVVPVVIDPIEALVDGSRSHVLLETGEAGLSVLAEAPAVANDNASPAIVFELLDIPIVTAADHSFPKTVQKRPAAAMRSESATHRFSIVTPTRSGGARGKVHTENGFALPTVTAASPRDNAATGREREIAQRENSQSAELLSGQIDGLLDGWWLPHVILTHAAPSRFTYPSDCCGGQHCRPVSCTTMTAHSDGSIDWTGLHFTSDQVHPSKDGECHVCLGYLQTGLREPYCAFVAGTM